MIRSLLAALLFLAAAPACAQTLRFTCGDDAHARAKALEWLSEASASPAARDADQAAGEKAYHTALALHAQLFAGKPVDPFYEKRLLRHGTQGHCTEAGAWEPFATEAPEGLDARRASMGLPPEATYVDMFHCGKASPR